MLYRRAEAMACWAQVSAAVLLVSGAKSEFAAGAMPIFARAQELIIPNCGHMVHLEQPEALAAAVEQFLAGAMTVV